MSRNGGGRNTTKVKAPKNRVSRTPLPKDGTVWQKPVCKRSTNAKMSQIWHAIKNSSTSSQAPPQPNKKMLKHTSISSPQIHSCHLKLMHPVNKDSRAALMAATKTREDMIAVSLEGVGGKGGGTVSNYLHGTDGAEGEMRNAEGGIKKATATADGDTREDDTGMRDNAP